MFDRHPNASDAASNLAALCNVLQGALTRRVTLFATLSQPG